MPQICEEVGEQTAPLFVADGNTHRQRRKEGGGVELDEGELLVLRERAGSPAARKAAKAKLEGCGKH